MFAELGDQSSIIEKFWRGESAKSVLGGSSEARCCIDRTREGNGTVFLTWQPEIGGYGSSPASRGSVSTVRPPEKRLEERGKGESDRIMVCNGYIVKLRHGREMNATSIDKRYRHT